MIHKLILTRFGKFREAAFDLAPVTLVVGPNEAGKTTFFDGLFQALCRPRESKVEGKALRDRYGPDRKAEVTLSGEFEVSDDEFLNLYAVRAGDLQLKLGQGSGWMEKLKAGLFHGGLDPAVLAKEFERRSSDNRTFVHSKELDALREKAAKVRETLLQHRGERESLLAKEKTLADQESRLQETRRLRERAQWEILRLEGEMAWQEKIAQRQKLAGFLARLQERENLEVRLRELEPFREDRREELHGLAEDARTLSAKLQAERGKQDLQAQMLSQAREECRRLETAQVSALSRSARAEKLLGEARVQGEAKLAGSGAGMLAGAAAVCMAAGLAAAGFLTGTVVKTAALAFATALTAGLIFLAVGRFRARARGRSGADLARWKDRWILGEMDVAGETDAGPAGPLGLAEISTWEGFLGALEKRAGESRVYESQCHSAREKRADLEAGLARLEDVVAGLDASLEAARKSEKAWLDRHGVASAEAYALKVSQRAEAEARLDRLRGELQALAPGDGDEGFRRDVLRKLQALDEEGVPTGAQDEAAWQRLKNARQEAQREKEAADGKERMLIAAKADLAGEIRGTLGKLAGEIVDGEERLAGLDAEIQVRETDKRAAGVAMKIFQEIGDGADLLLTGLAREMESMLGLILPGERGLTLQGLDSKQIKVEDAGGEDRSLEGLSSGTRDTVVLAAKLALALKHREGPGVLVLDDPFLAMDREREEKALNLLQDFHSRHGWQIIILSKEFHLKDLMKRIFSQVRIIELAPGTGVVRQN